MATGEIQQFDAATIARGAGMSKREALSLLADAPAVIVGARKLWAVTVLPARLAEVIGSNARKQGFRTLGDFLEAPAKEWISPLPWDAVCEADRAEALRLKEALRPSVVRNGDPSLSSGRFVELGRADYARIFGEVVTERWWREIWKRTCDRAGAGENFDRDEIYLRECPRSSQKPAADQNRELGQAIRILLTGNPRTRNVKIWDAVFLEYERRLELGGDEKATRRDLCRFLIETAPALVAADAKDKVEAIRVSFRRQYAEWIEGGRSLEAIERRSFEREEPYAFTPDEWKALVSPAVKLDNCDLAWRRFLSGVDCRPETRAHFWRDPSARRLRMPRWIRRKIGGDVRNQQDYQRGPRTARLNGAHSSRDPATLAAGDSDQSDDKTLDFLWWDDVPVVEGDGLSADGVWFGQGQLLPWIDERSWLVYSLWLVADKNYNAFDIRNSWSEKVRRWGLPRDRVHVEMGHWKDAAVWAGRRLNETDRELGIEQTEEGIRRCGIKIRNATLPRGKLIERVLGSLTDLLPSLPGYVGRNQQLEKFEDTQRRARLVRSRQAHPSEVGFLHKSQVIEHLMAFCNEMNATTKRGKYHEKWIGNKLVNLSPTQAYEEFFTTKLVGVPTEFSHLFQRNEMIRKVTRNGVSIRYGQRVFEYRNAELGCFKGQQVRCFFDPSDPSTIRVLTMDEKTRFPVPLLPKISHNATPEEIAADARSKADFDSYHREVHRCLRPAFREDFVKEMFRYPVVLSTTRADNAELASREDEMRNAIKDDHRNRKAAVRITREVGLPLDDGRQVTTSDVDDLNLLNRFLTTHGQSGK